jgi:hypothetical protein
MHVCSIDIGSGYTKFTSEQTGVFENINSIVCETPKEDFFATKEIHEVKFDGMSYLVGKDAISYGHPKNYIDTLHDEWAGSSGWKALLYYSLYSMDLLEPMKPLGVLKKDNTDKTDKAGSADKKQEFKIVTGLPQALFGCRRKDVEERLNGEHVFEIDDNEYKIIIHGQVVPQAASAILDYVQTVKGVSSESIGIIDVGTYTTGFSVMENGRFVAYRGGGYNLGVSQLVGSVQKYIQQEKGMSLPAVKVAETIISGKYRYKKEVFDITKEISRLAMTLVAPFIDALREKWEGNGEDLIVCVTGGGSPYFYEAISTHISHADIIEDPFYSVVRGFHLINMNK